MKTVLCYGDSNTYGFDPQSGMRYPENVRWTGVLSGLLGKEYKVIEEGCNGRTTIFDDPYEGWKNGLTYLLPCLNSHKPVDIVILMLGTNDLKETFHASAEEIARGADILVKQIISFTAEEQGFVPDIILVSPAKIGEGLKNSMFYGDFRESSIERSKEFPRVFKKVADENECIFVDAAQVVEPSPIDSVHLSAKSHKKLAEEFYRTILCNVSDNTGASADDADNVNVAEKQKLIINNIQSLIKMCDDYILSLKEFSMKEPSARDIVSETIENIDNLRDTWREIFERLDKEGLKERGELSYSLLSYKSSYAFVILSEFLNKLRFELEKAKLLDSYLQGTGYH